MDRDFGFDADRWATLLSWDAFEWHRDKDDASLHVAALCGRFRATGWKAVTTLERELILETGSPETRQFVI
jgi:hypothetical protein